MKTAADYKAQGNVAFGQKSYEEAIENFTKAIELDPSDPVFYSNRSACHASLTNYDDALNDAQKSLEINPQFIKGYSRKAFALYKLERTEDALKVIDEGLRLDPSNEQLLKDKKKIEEPPAHQINDLMSMLKNPTIQKLLKENPQMAQQFLSNPQLLQQLLSNPGFAEMFSGKNDQGQQPYADEYTQPTSQNHAAKEQAAQHSRADNLPTPSSQLEGLKNIANKLYQERKFTEAIAKYDECIKLDDKNMLVRNNKAACFIELQDFESAHEVVSQAIERYREIDFAEKTPAHLAKLYARQAKVYALQNNTEEAISAYQSSLLEENNSQVEYDLKELKKAKAKREREAYLDPALADQHREKGNEYFSKGEFGKALEEYEEASKRNPNDPKIYNNRASCFIKIMNYQQALIEVEKALKIDPAFLKALLRKGSIHQFLKEYHKAIEIYQKVLGIDSANEEAKKGIIATNAQISQSMHGENDEQRVQRAMADPEIAAIVSDPMIRIALEQMQQNPRNMNEYMKDTNLGPKIMKLIQAGVIRTS